MKSTSIFEYQLWYFQLCGFKLYYNSDWKDKLKKIWFFYCFVLCNFVAFAGGIFLFVQSYSQDIIIDTLVNVPPIFDVTIKMGYFYYRRHEMRSMIEKLQEMSYGGIFCILMLKQKSSIANYLENKISQPALKKTLKHGKKVMKTIMTSVVLLVSLTLIKLVVEYFHGSKETLLKIRYRL